MLGLVGCANSTIDSVSLSTTDNGDGGLWLSDMGQRYLELQRNALSRGVRIRRLFLLDHTENFHDAQLLNVCDQHRAIGIAVRVLDTADAPRAFASGFWDFTIFDDAISYEYSLASRSPGGLECR